MNHFLTSQKYQIYTRRQKINQTFRNFPLFQTLIKHIIGVPLSGVGKRRQVYVECSCGNSAGSQSTRLYPENCINRKFHTQWIPGKMEWRSFLSAVDWNEPPGNRILKKKQMLWSGKTLKGSEGILFRWYTNNVFSLILLAVAFPLYHGFFS